ncbi:hypothetical protein BJ742DRAFT_802836 [Cladochytrium replicatum]|nr:hypothetical protein BJ742DRAFT_802836 [Cladochytrium replicatum]
MSDSMLTIWVKNIPEVLRDRNEDLVEFLKHFGAVEVRTSKKPGLRGTAFADFSSREEAERAVFRISHLKPFGQQLRAEFARQQKQNGGEQSSESGGSASKEEMTSERDPRPITSTTMASASADISKPKLSNKTTDKPANSISDVYSKVVPIAPKLGLLYPPSPQIRYKYPPPNDLILGNICHAISAVPKLYVQVLHLMNKMNLPPPFTENDVVSSRSGPKGKSREIDETIASDESELETEMDTTTPESSQLRSTRLPFDPLSGPRRKRKSPADAVTGTSGDNSTVVPSKRRRTVRAAKKEQALIPLSSDLSRQSAMAVDKIDKTNPSHNEAVDANQHRAASLSSHVAAPKSVNVAHKAAIKHVQVSSLGLHLKCFEISEIRKIRGFSSYSTGSPSRILCIKNLNKSTKAEELDAIYRRFENADPSQFLAKKMKGSRMNSQAFIYFSNADAAEQALNEYNGRVLRGRPMIIEFGRNDSAQDKSELHLSGR